MRLNVGCGDWPQPGWVNVDVCPAVHPQVVAAADRLPFADRSMAAVYLGHVLEHVPLRSVTAVLAEVGRVLAAGGVVCTVGPDLDRAAGVDPVTFDAIRFGERRWPGDCHMWEPTAALTGRLLAAVWADTVEVPVGDVDGGWPLVSRAGWQCAFVSRPG